MTDILGTILGAVSNAAKSSGSSAGSSSGTPIGGSQNSFMPFSTGGVLAGSGNTAQGEFNKTSTLLPVSELPNSMFPSTPSGGGTVAPTTSVGSAPTPFSQFATPAATGGTPQVVPPGTGPTLPPSVTNAAAGPNSILQQIIQATNPGANVVNNPDLTYATGS